MWITLYVVDWLELVTVEDEQVWELVVKRAIIGWTVREGGFWRDSGQFRKSGGRR